MNLAATSVGTGPGLVLLHGLFGAGDNLRALARGLEAERTVHLPDLPNHGDSPPSDRISYPVMADAVVDWIDRTFDAPIDLGGHSMGAKVAMFAALIAPERVRSLIVLDMAPRRYPETHRRIIAAMRSLPLEQIGNRTEADRHLARDIDVPAVRAFLLKSLARGDDGYRWKLNLPVIDRDYANILDWPAADLPAGASYPGPALFVGGGRSTYLEPDRDRELVLGYFPAAGIEILPGAGHWIHSDAPDAVTARVRRFLSEVDAGRTGRGGSRP